MTRPTIGFALGGGVARGWAHIGVIHGLAELGIAPQVIAGTSIGALVGGAYLAGHLPTLEAWARSLTKRRLIGYIDFLTNGSGLLGGRRLAREMEAAFGGTRIEGLPRRYCAVATELATGHEVWLQEGDLIEAIRASYALPGVFAPVNIAGEWLIDGALVNPVPVSVARALGARLVIAVTLNGDSFGKSNLEEGANLKSMELEVAPPANGNESLWSRVNPQRLMMRQVFGTRGGAPGMGTVMLGALNIVMDRLSRSRMAGDPPDVLISPRIGHISLLDFDRADEAIELGRQAVTTARPYLEEALAVLR